MIRNVYQLIPTMDVTKVANQRWKTNNLRPYIYRLQTITNIPDFSSLSSLKYISSTL